VIVSIGACAVAAPTFPVVVAVESPSLASLRDGGASVQPRPTFPFAGRSAVDPVHSISLLIMILPLMVPAGRSRSCTVCHDQHGSCRTFRVGIVGSFHSGRGCSL
jgi:hypothetical protein